jgi:hypothetical protein
MALKRTLKPYLVAGLATMLFATLVIFLPQRRTTGEAELYYGPPISHASVQHEIFGNTGVPLQQLNGVKIFNADTGRFTYYFEYIANKQDTLRRIAALPFLKDNRRTSLSYQLLDSFENPLDGSKLSKEEYEASSFYWDARGEEFTFYECYRSPMKHTILLSKNSDRVLHKVEVI